MYDTDDQALSPEIRAAEQKLAALYAELRAWTATHDDHVRAAVELLINHDYWLRNGHFVRAAVNTASDGRYIAWTHARTAFDAGAFDRSSSTELAVLDLAICLGENRFRLSQMWRTATARMMAEAIADAGGVDPADPS